MISKEYDKYVVVCDNCETKMSEEASSFYEAVENKKKYGWQSKKYSDGWKDLCVDCRD